jgi:hypothetical protein
LRYAGGRIVGHPPISFDRDGAMTIVLS